MRVWPFRRRRSRWAGVDFMTLVPAHSARQANGEAPDSDVVLLMPRFAGTLFARWLQPRLRPEKKFIKVPLDARGSFLWRQIDGRRDVAALTADFVAAFPEDSEQAEERVCQYLYALEQNGFVSFVNLNPES